MEVLLICKHEICHGEHPCNGGLGGVEEPQQAGPPKFCDRTDRFTVAVIEEQDLLKTEFSTTESIDIRLSVLSIEKPDLVMAGWRDDQHPYVPLFSSRNSEGE